jgi:spore coat protein CotH
VPAPRTAYAWLQLSVQGQWERKPLGLYLMVENVDEDFAFDRFGSKRVPIFKPVTYDLFQDLGEEWAAYAPIYDLKTEATPEQKQRVIDFARLVTHTADAEFAKGVADFLEIEEFAGFVAGLVLLSSYDGFLSTGQNFYLYLDPRTNRFGFIPWDLDHAWGGFPMVGTTATRARASVWQPWVSRNRFLERMMKVEAFRESYRGRLNQMLATSFVPERLNRRIDEMGMILRSPTAAESSHRLKRLEIAISDRWRPDTLGNPTDPNRPPHQLKRFIANRAQSVRDQLDGRTKGLVLSFTGFQ